MSKYYKAEDIQELIAACIWRMTLAKERGGEGFVEYDKKVLDVEELRKRLLTLPTIEVSEDAISREDAVNALIAHFIPQTYTGEQVEQASKLARKIMANAPSVIPKPKEGEWIKEFNGNGWNDYWDYTCPNCGKKYERADSVLYDSSFCPNCGAKMKGVVNEIG